MNMLFGKRRPQFVPGMRRYEMPLLVTFDEGTFLATDWNLEGCRLLGYHGKRTGGDGFNITGISEMGNETVGVFIHARVEKRSWLYSEANLVFEDINETGFQMLNTLIDRCVLDMASTRRASRS